MQKGCNGVAWSASVFYLFSHSFSSPSFTKGNTKYWGFVIGRFLASLAYSDPFFAVFLYTY